MPTVELLRHTNHEEMVSCSDSRTGAPRDHHRRLKSIYARVRRLSGRPGDHDYGRR